MQRTALVCYPYYYPRYMHLLLFSVTLAIGAVVAAYSDIVGVKRAFVNAHIPQDLHITFNPKALLAVTFPQPGSVPPITIQPGMQLSTNASSLPPTYNISPSNIGHGPFVLAMVDPDVPTPQNPSVSQIRHFLGGNLFVGGQHGLLVNTTPAITEFTGPHPAATSDPHRYIFLLFKQPPGFNEQKVITPEMDRRYFNISQFAEQVRMGDAVAGNFFYAGPHT